METLIQLVEGPFGAFAMAGSGIMAILVVGLWWPITAFLEAWWWGVLTLLFPPTFLVFACVHFQKAKKPLILGLFFPLVSIAIFILRSFLATFFVAPV
jgi:hypothetical protein